MADVKADVKQPFTGCDSCKCKSDIEFIRKRYFLVSHRILANEMLNWWAILLLVYLKEINCTTSKSRPVRRRFWHLPSKSTHILVDSMYWRFRHPRALQWNAFRLLRIRWILSLSLLMASCMLSLLSLSRRRYETTTRSNCCCVLRILSKCRSGIVLLSVTSIELSIINELRHIIVTSQLVTPLRRTVNSMPQWILIYCQEGNVSNHRYCLEYQSLDSSKKNYLTSAFWNNTWDYFIRWH